jgi:hypothetical protein
MTRPIPKPRSSLSTDPKRIRSGNWLYFGGYMIARLWDNSGFWLTQCGSTS